MSAGTDASARAIVAAFHQGIGVGDRIAVADALAPDVRVHSPIPGTGRDLALLAAEHCFASHDTTPPPPDPCFSIVDGDIVATCYRMPQRTPGGDEAEFFWIDAVRVTEGQISEWWPSINQAAPTQLTWVAPDPAQAGVGVSSTPVEELRRLAIDFYRRVFDSEDADAVPRYVTEDYRQHAGHLPPGREGLQGLVSSLFPRGARPMPEPMTLQPVVLAAEGDVVVHGVQLWQRSDATAGTYPYIVFDAYRVRDGKLSEHWSGVNPAAPPLHGAGPTTAIDDGSAA